MVTIYFNNGKGNGIINARKLIARLATVTQYETFDGKMESISNRDILTIKGGNSVIGTEITLKDGRLFNSKFTRIDYAISDVIGYVFVVYNERITENDVAKIELVKGD